MLVVDSTGKIISLSLTSRIHEGVRFTPKGELTLLDKFAAVFTEIAQSMALGRAEMMIPAFRSKSGDVYLHRKSKEYRRMVMRKMDAFHWYIQFGCIAKGMLQYLSVSFGRQVLDRFGGWMRTMNTSQAPSESVVATAIRNCLPGFYLDSPKEQILKKFIMDRIDPRRFWPMRMAA